jgi:hypothetical protein
LLPEFDKHHNFQYTPVSSRIWSESDYPVKQSPPPQARIFGMTPLIWTILVASITAMIVGAAVGAGMGTRLHEVPDHCDKSPLPLSEVDTAGLLLNYTVARSQEIYNVTDPCTAARTGQFIAANGGAWTTDCNKGWTGGDVANIWAYAYEECINACASINYRLKSNNRCIRIQWVKNFASAPMFGNCFLKDNHSTPITNDQGWISA